MTQPAPARFLALCALVVFMVMGSYAHADSKSVVALPNGHYLERDRAGNIQLVNRKGKKIVSEPIAGYAVYRLIVTGLVGPEVSSSGAYPNDVALPETDEPRYFVLDTSTGRLEKGLTAADWKAKMAELGVSSPAVKAPILPK